MMAAPIVGENSIGIRLPYPPAKTFAELVRLSRIGIAEEASNAR